MISGVVLAAGRSTRFPDQTKQLLPVNGRPMLQHVIEAAYQASLDEIIVVLGHEADAIRAGIELPPRATVLVNLDHAAGLSTSLVAGLEAADPTSEAAVVLMGDQPRISPAVIRALVAAFEETRMPVVRAVFSDAPGPALLAAAIWDDLKELDGDAGARDFIEANPNLVEEIAFGEPAPADIDTPEDYRKAVEEGAAGWEDTRA